MTVRYLLNRYPASVGAKLTYPRDAHPLDTPGDTWEYDLTRAPDDTNTYPRDKDLYATAKEMAQKRVAVATKGQETDGDKRRDIFIPIYKNLYAAKYGINDPPFNDSSAMVLPVKWTTGYSQEVQDAMDELTQMRSYAKEIADSIGVINTTINTMAQEVAAAREAIEKLNEKLGNGAWVKLQNSVDPGVVKSMNAEKQGYLDFIASYNDTMNRLRTDANTLNQELYRTLNDYKKKAVILGINDDFAKELKAAAGSGRIQGTMFGGAGGMILAGLIVYGLAQQRRFRADDKSGTGRGINNLFMRN